MNDYDFYLRHASVHDGAWTGFGLARKGLAGIDGFPSRPNLHWIPWVLDPDNPGDPSLGAWGVQQWRFDVALIDPFVGLLSMPPDDGRDAAEMRADLQAFVDLPAFELKNVDAATYTVRMTAYSEQLIEPYDKAHPNGGWIARIELAETTA